MKNLRSPKLLALGAALLAGAGFFLYSTAEYSPAVADTTAKAPAVAGKPLAVVPSASEVAPAALAQVAPPAPLHVGFPWVPEPSVRLQAGLVLPSQSWLKFAPKQITTEAVPGLPVDFTLASSHVEQGRTINVYRNSIPGAFVATAASATEMVGNVVIPFADTYAMRVDSSGVTYTLVKPRAEGSCAVSEPPQVPVAAQPTQPVAMALVHSADSPVAALPAPALVSAPAAGTVTVDVGFCATAATITAQGGADSLKTKILAGLAACNQVLVNSGVDMVWRMTHLQQVADYAIADPAGKPTTMEALNSISAGGSNYAAIQAVEDADYTDLECLIGLMTSFSDAGGRAWSPGRQAVVDGVDYGALAHELGHNFGLKHDRLTDHVPDTNLGYNYGYTWKSTYLGPKGENWGGQYGDVMSYFSYVPYFSTPLLTYNDGHNIVPLGVAEGTLGPDYGMTEDYVPLPFPRGPADGARYLREQMAAVAATRSAPTMPVITSQPVGVSVQVGSAINLSVTATGGNLTYIWKKDGVAIANATSASYSKTSALADAGAYTVSVTNRAGSVTSNSATVTVTAVPVPPVTPPSGGGGGGGAMSEWFLAVLASIYGLRRLTRRGR